MLEQIPSSKSATPRSLYAAEAAVAEAAVADAVAAAFRSLRNGKHEKKLHTARIL